MPVDPSFLEAVVMGAVVAGADDFTAILSRWHADPAEFLSCCRRASEWAASTLGAECQFGRAAQSIVELLDKRTGQ